jgi:hypothetical protein
MRNALCPTSSPATSEGLILAKFTVNLRAVTSLRNAVYFHVLWCQMVSIAVSNCEHHILRKDHPEVLLDEAPHGCYEGWVYLGAEGGDENGEHVEEIERVACLPQVPPRDRREHLISRWLCSA